MTPLPRYIATNEELAKGGASLACLMNLSDTVYGGFPPPSHMLEWDMAGSINVSEDHELFLEGGEIEP